MKNITLADKAGFCFGVKRAVETALDAEKKYNKKIYTLGPLIHNNDVVQFLRENNIYPIELMELNNLSKGDVIIIRSHGVGAEVIRTLEKKELEIINATCPYVTNIHKKVEKYYEQGYKVVIVGDKNHPEVIGINGWCNNEAVISKDGSDLSILPNRVCVVSQTTEKQDNLKAVLNSIIEHCGEVVVFNTICSATDVRQKSANELSKDVDAMIVIGGKNSSNTTKLFEICKKNCENTVHVESAGEIPRYIIDSQSINKIGVTAGASTPDWIIKEAIKKMNNTENLEMNEQLKFMEENDYHIHVGKLVKGEIVSLNEREAFVNLGYKVDGYLPLHEVTKEEGVKLTDVFEIGQNIEAKVMRIKNEDGNVVLSQLEVQREEAYNILRDAFENKTPIKVKIKQNVKGGLLANFKGVRVFIPASHVSINHIQDLNKFVNEEFEVLIIEHSKHRGNTKIVASIKELLQKERDAKQEETWKTLNTGDIVEGIVRRIADFGAFVEINGVDGLLHISEISWGKVQKIDKKLKIGDKIKVYILEADKENKKLSLSIKQLTENPWKNVSEKYPVGNVVLGKIVRFTNFGAFVELEPGVDGLLHISQISHERINKPSDVLKLGESVKAKILEVNEEAKKISLSMKEIDEI